ncbi:50S ribosomal protein L5 [Candidatus Johnevansia muelleri]|uniref:Large ribosomal subunit protein uL5 n=1 Tax=Candidatus Johnevansia muelleri TaxID=1495769 RepID=A0A078KHV5_9GAMM|nr:50S ribosomal protein L5 [Candidatus Evansia muelleri]
MKKILFKKLYKNTLIKNKQNCGYINVMQVQKITKVTLNMGLGKTDNKLIETSISDMKLISGQKPILTKCRKSIADFKIRQGWPIGIKVTLRNSRMWEFIYRLINIVLPRIRDFRGLNKKSFDGRGNYSIGIIEQIIFPEIEYDKLDKIRGLNITLTTNANNDNEGYAILSALNFPFIK